MYGEIKLMFIPYLTSEYCITLKCGFIPIYEQKFFRFPLCVPFSRLISWQENVCMFENY